MNESFTVATERPKQSIDVTEEVRGVVARSGVDSGLCQVMVLHSRCAIVLNETADPNIGKDVLRALSETFPEREIFVLDRQIAAHPACVPDADHMFLGDIPETLTIVLTRLGRNAVLAHSDIGTGDSERSRELAARIAPLLAPSMLPGGIVLSDQLMVQAEWTELTLPNSIPLERYHIYRA